MTMRMVWIAFACVIGVFNALFCLIAIRRLIVHEQTKEGRLGDVAIICYTVMVNVTLFNLL